MERDFQAILSAIKELQPESVKAEKEKVAKSVETLMKKLKEIVVEIGFRS